MWKTGFYVTKPCNHRAPVEVGAPMGELGTEGLGGPRKRERKSPRRGRRMLTACLKASPSPGRDSIVHGASR